MFYKNPKSMSINYDERQLIDSSEQQYGHKERSKRKRRDGGEMVGIGRKE